MAWLSNTRPNLTEGGFPAAVVAYTLARIMNSYFFAATLAARSEYAPTAARGQVFVRVGALKITAGSAGTSLANVVVSHVTQLPLFLAVAIIAAAVGASVQDRRTNATMRAKARTTQGRDLD